MPLYIPSYSTQARGTGFVCVRVASPQQHQHPTTIPAAVASNLWIRALALACTSGQTLLLQWQDVFSFIFQSSGTVLLSYQQYHPVRQNNIYTQTVLAFPDRVLQHPPWYFSGVANKFTI